jgi:hypothetical protein
MTLVRSVSLIGTTLPTTWLLVPGGVGDGAGGVADE